MHHLNTSRRTALLAVLTLTSSIMITSSTALSQGRTITSFPYLQPFSFVPSGTSATPNGPIGTAVFPSTDVDGGELTVDSNTSSLLVNGSTTGLNNNVGAGGMLRIQTSGSALPTTSQGFIVHTSFTGYIAGSVSINWSKVTNGTSTRASELRIAVSADGAPFSDLVSVSYDNSSTAQSGTLSTTLPSALDGIASVRFHVYAINVSGTGAHPRVIVDSLRITATEESPLPVELASFSVTYRDAHVEIAWRTASEHNNEGFEVQRANAADTTFAPIASYRTHDELKGLGTSATGREYRIVDDLPEAILAAGATLLYRLVDVSTDGSRTEHAPKTVRVEATPPAIADPVLATMRLEAVGPVPASDRIDVTWRQADDRVVEIDVYDRLGARRTGIASEPTPRGVNRRTLDVGRLPNGSYTVVLMSDGIVRSHAFIVQR